MIKTLTASIRQYKKPAMLAPVVVTLEVLMEVIIPIVMASMIDLGIQQGNMGEIIKYGIILLVLAVISLAFGAYAGRLAAVASCGFASNLRSDMYNSIQNFAFSNIDRFSTASLVTRMTTDVTNTQMAFQMVIRMAVRSPIMMIMALVVSFRVNVQLSMIFLICMPFLALGLWVIIKHAHPLFVKVFKTYDNLNSVVQENLRGIRVVKSFTRENYEIDKFENISDRIYRLFSKAEKTVAFNMPLMQLAMYTCTLLVSWFGAKMVVRANGLTTGQLMSLITYSAQILMGLMMLSMVFVMLTISKASMLRIAEVLEEKSDITNKENPVTTVKNGDVKFDGVSFSYSRKSDKPVLDGITLDIKSGQTVGIIGATGSSKSSLVQLIPRLYDVSAGSVSVGGVDVRDYDIETLRNSVAVVLQKNELFSGTITENLRWGNENASEDEIVRACKIACADDFIQKLPEKYNTYIEQGGTNVSGGQKQRLCIARALLKKPEILILDDSTSAVDTKTDALIRKAFKTEIPDTTKIIIAQRVASVQDADMIIVMDDGKINAVGTHKTLLDSCEIYNEVYQSQVKGGGEDAQTDAKINA